MAPAKLTDHQKQELVQRFREGENTQLLADHFGCSPTTVTRMVRAELGQEAYGALRDDRLKKASRDKQIPLAIDGSTPLAEGPLADVSAATATAAAAAAAASLPEPEDGLDGAQASSQVLAIDDADDFSEDDADNDGEEELSEDDDDPQSAGDFHTVAVLPIAVDDQRETRPAPWTPAVLPACAYLLVDKTVELQARPLGEMPELGRLPSEEKDRQALVLFTNPRQAKRQCGRTQRVIKLPDPALLGRTAPYLLAQGISRVVIEGALYALPDHQ